MDFMKETLNNLFKGMKDNIQNAEKEIEKLRKSIQADEGRTEPDIIARREKNKQVLNRSVNALSIIKNFDVEKGSTEQLFDVIKQFGK